MMNISVIGTGYVGLVQGVVLAEFGMNVTCMDIDEQKILSLRNGVLPIYEPGLQELLNKNVAAGRLSFTTDMEKAVYDQQVIFIAVGTPPQDDGSADLQYVKQVAQNIGAHLHTYTVVVNKSTVPIGTGRQVRQMIQQTLDDRGADIPFDVVSNPEFLREGRAVADCLLPNRIVIGTESPRAIQVMKQVYDVLFLNQTPFLFTNLETAEMIKYASNAFLAVKISYINEMALLADRVGADIQEVARGMGMDGRISPKFLHAGPGYGGSCFPKDTRAIADIARREGETLSVIEAAINANEKQKRRMVERIVARMEQDHPVSGCTFAIWGLSFKPETDDMRESPSLDIIRGLVAQGAHIQAFCPQGMKEAAWRLADIADHIEYAENEYDAARNADALVLITEWNAFRGADLQRVRSLMRGDIFFDLRNALTKNTIVRNIFQYYGVGC